MYTMLKMVVVQRLFAIFHLLQQSLHAWNGSVKPFHIRSFSAWLFWCAHAEPVHAFEPFTRIAFEPFTRIACILGDAEEDAFLLWLWRMAAFFVEKVDKQLIVCWAKKWPGWLTGKRALGRCWNWRSKGSLKAAEMWANICCSVGQRRALKSWWKNVLLP